VRKGREAGAHAPCPSAAQHLKSPMPFAKPCLSSQRPIPGAAEAFRRAVQEACSTEADSPSLLGTPACVYSAEPSAVRSTASDSSVQRTHPELFARLQHAANLDFTVPDRFGSACASNAKGGEAALPEQRQEPLALVTVRASSEDDRYIAHAAVEMHLAGSRRMSQPIAARGARALPLKPGMCRYVSAQTLMGGIEFGGLNGGPFEAYEFALQLPTCIRLLTVWATHQHGEADLRLARADTGIPEHSQKLIVGTGLSLFFEIFQTSELRAGRCMVIAKIGGTHGCFSGARLYLKAL
jgi:hypothetical protein